MIIINQKLITGIISQVGGGGVQGIRGRLLHVPAALPGAGVCVWALSRAWSRVVVTCLVTFRVTFLVTHTNAQAHGQTDR